MTKKELNTRAIESIKDSLLDIEGPLYNELDDLMEEIHNTKKLVGYSAGLPARTRKLLKDSLKILECKLNILERIIDNFEEMPEVLIKKLAFIK